MKKGDKVRYYKIAKTKYDSLQKLGEYWTNKRVLQVIPVGSKKGIFVGWSFLREGIVWPHGDEISTFQPTREVKVAKIIPDLTLNRYIKPVNVLPEDLRNIE